MEVEFDFDGIKSEIERFGSFYKNGNWYIGLRYNGELYEVHKCKLWGNNNGYWIWRKGWSDWEKLKHASTNLGLKKLKQFDEVEKTTSKVNNFLENFREAPWYVQWDLLQMLNSGGKAIVEFAFEYPVIAFILSKAWLFNKKIEPDTDYSYIPEMLDKDVNDIVRELGFPDDRYSSEIIMKFAPYLVVEERIIFELRKLLWELDESIRKILASVNSINSTVWNFLKDKKTHKFLTVDFLNELSLNDSQDNGLSEYDEFYNYINFLKKYPVVSLEKGGKINSVVEMQLRIAELKDKFGVKKNFKGRVRKLIDFPEEPLLGTEHIIPIKSVGELGIEMGKIPEETKKGVRFFGYFENYEEVKRSFFERLLLSVTEGKLYLYKMLEPQRATVLLGKRRKLWGIERIIPHNKRLMCSVRGRVKRWINDYSELSFGRYRYPKLLNGNKSLFYQREYGRLL